MITAEDIEHARELAHQCPPPGRNAYARLVELAREVMAAHLAARRAAHKHEAVPSEPGTASTHTRRQVTTRLRKGNAT